MRLDDIEDEELGIAPLVMAALPALTGVASNLLGGLTGGSKGGGGAGDILGGLLGGLTGGGSKGAVPSSSATGGIDLEAIKGVVQGLLAQLPPSIKSDLRETLQELQASATSREELARNIKAAVEPQLAAAIANLQTATIQREATSEHNALVKDNERWEGNKRVQTLMLSKILELSAKLDEYNKTNNRTRAAMGLPAT